jgi:hypothetical protein
MNISNFENSRTLKDAAINTLFYQKFSNLRSDFVEFSKFHSYYLLNLFNQANSFFIFLTDKIILKLDNGI